MDPLFAPLLLAAVWAGVAAFIYVTVYFADLTAQIIYGWFKKFAYLMVANDRRAIENRDHIQFTVADTVGKALKSHDFNVVQGVFDNRSGKVIDARVIQADSVDTTIKQAHSHGRKEVALWQ